MRFACRTDSDCRWVAAAALLTDYVLTVAVSISAGIYAITSFAPSLSSHKVGLSLACLVLIVLANLRGVRESGMLTSPVAINCLPPELIR